MQRSRIIAAVICFSVGVSVSVLWRLQQTDTAEVAVIALWNQSLQHVNHNQVTLSHLSASKTRMVVNFWATWCPPCLHEMPLLEAVAIKMPSVKFVGISHEESAVVSVFIQNNPIGYDILTSSVDMFDLFREIGNQTASLPYTLLLDGEGGVIRQKIGDFSTIEEIEDFIR